MATVTALHPAPVATAPLVTYNRKLLSVAFFVETVVAAIVLFAGIQLANRFGYAEEGEKLINLPLIGEITLT